MNDRKIYSEIISLLMIAVCLLIISCKGPEGPAGPPGGSEAWENAVNLYEDCVYLLGIIPSGEDYVIQIGTGWAISPTQIITNAHVAYGLYDLCHFDEYNSSNDKIVAVKNGTFTGRSATYELVDCSVHTGFNNLNPFSDDFAIFTVDTTAMSSYRDVSSNSSLFRTLQVGQGVGTLGFPGELSSSSMDGYQPIATFKNGTISALRPFDQKTTPQSADSNALVQYNFNVTGGTSGSPVFISDGNAIAINNSEVGVIIKDIYDNYVKIGLGDLNFGIRLDRCAEVMSMPFVVKVADFRKSDPSEYSTLQAGQFRVDFDWNSSYDFDLWLVVGKTHFVTGWISSSSRANIYPFCVHHGDDTYYGPEIATILQLTNEIKVYASKYSFNTAFSTSYTTCEISSSSGVIANITNPPSGYQDFWIIGTISPTGQFTLINQLTDDDPIDNVVSNAMAHLKDFNAIEKDRTILKNVEH